MGRLESFKQRGRNRQNRKRRPIIVIGCEGNNKTEEIYFKNFNSRKCIIKFSTGNSTDPVGIANDLIKFIDNEIGRENDDKYYVVLDTDVNQDKQSQIDKAKKILKQKKHFLFIIKTSINLNDYKIFFKSFAYLDCRKQVLTV